MMAKNSSSCNNNIFISSRGPFRQGRTRDREVAVFPRERALFKLLPPCKLQAGVQHPARDTRECVSLYTTVQFRRIYQSMKLLQRLESCSLAKATVLQPIGDITV
jgi:hypothetical protein